ncbi:LOW QUALITY PROTEIN: retbindin [Osmerus eperlanus]|uniref:LOW QUALITY PROTEIN: retbindin n=1 Tax=Osmerus eperlanus TaxID=29151 RepID=UPI002E120F20
MYQHGRDLCESVLGEAFVTVEDEVERAGPGEEVAGPGGHPCGWLTLSTADREVMAALSAEDEQDTTKRGLPQARAPCSRTPALPLQVRRANAALRRRSLQPDLEGSGSGIIAANC